MAHNALLLIDMEAAPLFDFQNVKANGMVPLEAKKMRLPTAYAIILSSCARLCHNASCVVSLVL